ncbi:hypothetical protein BJ742DRAFT_578790 [Cladochytrium replicatum]|nr:hypothetical protein BJ742DRAFT_578790 [Cladochytrium replicatum]
MPILPWEVIDRVLLVLGLSVDEPYLAYMAATCFKREFVRLKLYPWAASMDEASANGADAALEYHKAKGSYYTKYAIDQASLNGHLGVLKWWLSSGLDLYMSDNLIDRVSANGRVDVLEFWRIAVAKGLKWQSEPVGRFLVPLFGLWQTKLMWTDRAIDEASANGHINVLDWWLNRDDDSTWKPQISWTSAAIDMASANGHVEVLKWWHNVSTRNPNWKLKWTKKAMDLASQTGHVASLEWWKSSGLELKWSENVMDFASQTGVVESLEWWKSSGLEMKWNENAIVVAFQNGHSNVLAWWKGQGASFHNLYPLIIQAIEDSNIGVLKLWLDNEDIFTGMSHTAGDIQSRYLADITSACGNVEVLDWWSKYSEMMNYTSNAMDSASAEGSLAVLQWWKDINDIWGIECRYTAYALDQASINKHVYVLDWWIGSGLELKWSTDLMATLFDRKNFEALQWWSMSGLLPTELRMVPRKENTFCELDEEDDFDFAEDL